MTDRDIVTPGQIVFDRAEPRHEASAMVVIIPAAGMVEEQDAKTREAIRSADDNEEYDTSDYAQCVEVAYVDGHMSSETYTFPKERLRPATGKPYTLGVPPGIWAKSQMLCQLYQNSDLVETDVMEADVDGHVILTAKDMLLSADRYETYAVRDEDSDDESAEVMDCPECGENVHQTEPIESVGDGTAFGTITCEERGWEAREELVHKNTYESEKPIHE